MSSLAETEARIVISDRNDFLATIHGEDHT